MKKRIYLLMLTALIGLSCCACGQDDTSQAELSSLPGVSLQLEDIEPQPAEQDDSTSTESSQVAAPTSQAEADPPQPRSSQRLQSPKRRLLHPPEQRQNPIPLLQRQTAPLLQRNRSSRQFLSHLPNLPLRNSQKLPPHQNRKKQRNLLSRNSPSSPSQIMNIRSTSTRSVWTVLPSPRGMASRWILL